MKYKNNDFYDKEKKIHRVVKTNKVAKHKKSIYNMLSEEEDDEFFESDSDEMLNYEYSNKQR